MDQCTLGSGNMVTNTEEASNTGLMDRSMKDIGEIVRKMMIRGGERNKHMYFVVVFLVDMAEGKGRLVHSDGDIYIGRW